MFGSGCESDIDRMTTLEKRMQERKRIPLSANMQTARIWQALIFKLGCVCKSFFWSNVRDDGSPLAFGMTPAREAGSAGGMTKVPKAW